jgi:hypothetical protein
MTQAHSLTFFELVDAIVTLAAYTRSFSCLAANYKPRGGWLGWPHATGDTGDFSLMLRVQLIRQVSRSYFWRWLVGSGESRALSTEVYAFIDEIKLAA